jgi:hypothetical protein
MSHWNFWEWLAYTCVWVAALISAADSGVKIAPELKQKLSPILTSQWWAFTPLAAMSIGTLIFLLRELGTPLPNLPNIAVLWIALFAALVLVLAAYLSFRKKGTPSDPERVTVPVVNELASESDLPNVQKWMSPLEAIEAFADPGLRRESAIAFQRCDELGVLIKEIGATINKRILNSERNAIQALVRDTDEDQEMARLRQKLNNAQISAQLAWKRVVDDLIRQLKAAHLVARGLPFKEKLEGDWEVIRSAWWGVLCFDSYDQKMETVSGGGQTFKGVEIGKSEKRTGSPR